MTSKAEEEVMLDFAKGNLWPLLILQEVQENEQKWSSRKEIFRTLRNLQKCVKIDNLDDYSTRR